MDRGRDGDLARRGQLLRRRHRSAAHPERADGFYEWKGDMPGAKQPFHITRPGDELFAFGGIWEHWMAPDGSELESAAMLTTAPNAMMDQIHNRMPVVIEPHDYSRWLDHSRPDGKSVVDLMKPVRDEFFIARETQMPRPQRKKVEPPRPSEIKPEPKADDQLKLL